jgi:hypothetical protein
MLTVPCFLLRWAQTVAKRDLGKKRQRGVNVEGVGRWRAFRVTL